LISANIFTDLIDGFVPSTGALPKLGHFALVMIASVIFGALVGVTYMLTQTNRNPQQSFALTLILLPAVLTVIIMLVGSSIPRALSLGGAFAVIRYRSVQGDPKNIAHVLFCMAIGLACGMGFLQYAAVITLILCGASILGYFTGFGVTKNPRKILKIQIPENLNYQSNFDDILKEYTKEYKLVKVRTADLGSIFEINYTIFMPNASLEKEMIDKLRERNGNLPIFLLYEPEPEEF